MGQLVLLGLPIGNPEDITLRQLEALKTGKIFFVEDTRTFKALLKYLKIELTDQIIDSFHDHSDHNKIKRVMNFIEEKKTVYLASEAGSPIVSDPMFPIINKALEKNISLTTFPSVTSPMAALELSGLAPIPFHFHGFLSKTSGQKLEYIKELMGQKGTHLFFEGPHSVKDTIILIKENWPTLHLVLVKEITKEYETRVDLSDETSWKDTLENLNLRGEFCLLFYSDGTQNFHQEEVLELANNVYASKGKTKDLSRLLAKILNQNQKEIYQNLLKKG